MTANQKQTEAAQSIVTHDPEGSRALPAVIRGSLGFGLVSLAAFSVWAFGGRWFQSHLGEAGLSGACALVFVALAGVALHPLVRGPGAVLRFYLIFIPAFLGYAVVWCLAWFVLRFGAGEWLGSWLGCTAFVGIVSWRLRNARGWVQTSLILFALNSAGYFLGGQLFHWLLGPTGSTIFGGLSKPGVLIVAKLAWGFLYGLGFGAGIGYAFHAAQLNR